MLLTRRFSVDSLFNAQPEINKEMRITIVALNCLFIGVVRLSSNTFERTDFLFFTRRQREENFFKLAGIAALLTEFVAVL